MGRVTPSLAAITYILLDIELNCLMVGICPNPVFSSSLTIEAPSQKCRPITQQTTPNPTQIWRNKLFDERSGTLAKKL